MTREELQNLIAGGEPVMAIDLSGLDLSGLDLAGSIWEKVSLKGANLSRGRTQRMPDQ